MMSCSYRHPNGWTIAPYCICDMVYAVTKLFVLVPNLKGRLLCMFWVAVTCRARRCKVARMGACLLLPVTANMTQAQIS